MRAIARILCRPVSTISREIRRADTALYDATQAGQGDAQRRQRCVRKPVLVAGTALYQHVYDRLVYLRWSPPRGALKQGMIQSLRQAKSKRGVRRTAAARGFVPENQCIVHRPEDTERRLVPGHREGDFIKGAYNRSAVGVLVERKTRFVVLCKMDGCTSDAALVGYARQMKKLPAFLRQSMTYNRGSEIACHAELTKRLKLDIWFCDLHAPWQRGSNENTNGLLRQFLPKGADLSEVSQAVLNDIARLMNGRPRQTLNWKTSDEILSEDIPNFYKTVALDS